MGKISKKIILAMALGATLSACGPTNPSTKESAQNPSEEFEGIELKIQNDLANTSHHEINPFIYGTFIEHIDSCIYGGIWSELIMDRKFYKPVGQDVSQWNIQSGNVQMETEKVYSGEYALILNKDDGVRQNGIALDVKDYDGYLYAIGDGTIELKYVSDDTIVKKEIAINSNEYKKYSYNFSWPVRTSKGKLFITGLSGKVTIDSLSLMPSDNYHGMRKDTLDQLKELNSTFYRWPGGNFVSGYDFYDGIGPRDQRPTKRNLNYCGLEEGFASDSDRIAHDIIKIGSLGFYGAFDSNDFGIDEFVDMCRYLGAEPNIVVNSGLGQAQMARDEVEYCNGTTGYGAKRPGEPYNIKYFSIGNEMNGDWQLGHMPISQYVKKHNEFATEMKKVDPKIKLIGVGDNYSDWTQKMVDSCKQNMDYSSEHYYAAQDKLDSNAHIESLKKQTTMRIAKHRNVNGISNIGMCIDEYAYENAECASRLKDGMGVAAGLNEMLSNSDVVQIACYSSTVNATQGNIITDKFNAYMEGSGYAISLYRNNMQNHYLPVVYSKTKSDDFYEVCTTVNDDLTLMSVAVINATNDDIKITNPLFKNVKSIDYVEGNFLESTNDASRTELRRFKTETSGKSFIAKAFTITIGVVEI